MLGHRIHGCPAVKEYYDTGRVKVIGNQLHLPTGEPIPNDGRGMGLKASLNAWLAANTHVPSNVTASTPQRDPPPHTTSYSFEIIPEAAVSTGAYITEEADSDTGGDDDAYTTTCTKSSRQRKRTRRPPKLHPQLLQPHLLHPLHQQRDQ
jgi:hypothetical protein